MMLIQGAWLWRVKDWIDRGWMAKYGEKLPVMHPDTVNSPVAQAAGPEAVAAMAAARMRCSGCGAKVGSAFPHLQWAGSVQIEGNELGSTVLEMPIKLGYNHNDIPWIEFRF